MSEVCPHCGLPAVLPAICTEEVNAAIERRLDHDWELYVAGYEAGKRSVNVSTFPDAERKGRP